MRKTELFIASILGLLVGVSLCLRIALPYDDIFTGTWVKFASNDAYYYMRLVDNMVYNFPHIMSVDAYLLYPDGMYVGGAFHLFAWLLAGVSWVVGMGSPSQHLVDTVCVYVPAVMGALAIVPVYFIGRSLIGRWGGLLGAALIAVLPGEFLGRSILGYTDHHIAEVLLSTVAMMFLVMAVKSRSDRIKVFVYSSLAGLFFGLYCLTWQGFLLFGFILFLYFVVQFVIGHMKSQRLDYLCVMGAIFYGVAMLLFLPSIVGSPYELSYQWFYVAPMVGFLLLPFGLRVLSWFVSRKKLPTYCYPIAVMALGMFTFGLLHFISPVVSGMVWDTAKSVFVSSVTQTTTSELQPLLYPTGVFTLGLVWVNFGLAIFVALISLIGLFYLILRHGNPEMCLVAVWTVVILALTLGQRRFAYYLAVNVALLAGYLSWRMVSWDRLRNLLDVHRGILHKSEKARLIHPVVVKVTKVSLVVLVVLLVVFVPVVPIAVSTASNAYYTPSDEWCKSLDWLRENSQSPFLFDNYMIDYPIEYDWGQSVGTYYRLGVDEKATYGVLAWWDYGYWISRIAHRIPNSNPSQDPMAQGDMASFFTAQDEQTANEIAGRLGSRYVIVDLATATSKFWAIARYAGKSEFDYFGVYYAQSGDQLVPVVLYYPDYYRSLSSRLYNFNCEAVTPQNVWVISHEQKTDKKDRHFSMITDTKLFGDYNDAERYVSDHQSGNWRIVGNNPFVSPVLLDEVKHYELVYQSNSISGGVSEVKIFRYMD